MKQSEVQMSKIVATAPPWRFPIGLQNHSGTVYLKMVVERGRGKVAGLLGVFGSGVVVETKEMTVSLVVASLVGKNSALVNR